MGINEMSSRGLRVLCLAYRLVKSDSGSRLRRDSTSNLEEDLCCVGFVGIQDPLRPEAKEAVRKCQQAGIYVRMVTGDNINTAISIAREAGILTDGLTMEAKEASDIVLLDDNFASIVKSISWGRCVYDNIRKFLQFQLTVNLVALTTAFFAALFE